MSISEKIQRTGDSEVHLYKEGVFWVAYEESAYALSLVKPLKATKKYIKLLDREIISVGFPDSVLEKILPHFSVKERDPLRIVLEGAAPVNSSDFESWKQETPGREVKEVREVREGEEALMEKLRSFKLLQSTPMECMRFLEELQRTYC